MLWWGGGGWGRRGRGCHLQTLFSKPQPRSVRPVAFTPWLGLPNAATQRASGAAGGFGAWAGVPAHHSEALVFSVDPVLRAGGWLVPSFLFFFFFRRGVKVSYRSALPAGKAMQDTI